MQNTLIVIPCYNEEKRLAGHEFLAFVQQHDSVNFLFVNDCSTDGTGRILDELCLQSPARMKALHLPQNLGKAEAVRAGFVAAFADGYLNIGFWDADLATPLAEIVEFICLLERLDVEMVIGSRIRLMGRQIERQPARHYLGRLFATVASLVLGVTVYDTQCGAKLFRNTAGLRQVFARPFLVSWTFDVELLARCIVWAKGAGVNFEKQVVEKPLMCWLDIPGSKLKLKDFVKAIGELFLIWRYLQRAANEKNEQ